MPYSYKVNNVRVSESHFQAALAFNRNNPTRLRRIQLLFALASPMEFAHVAELWTIVVLAFPQSFAFHYLARDGEPCETVCEAAAVISFSSLLYRKRAYSQIKSSTMPMTSSHLIPLGSEVSPSASATAQVSTMMPVVGKASDQKADIEGLNVP